MSLLHYTQRETPPDKFRWQCKRTGHRIIAMDRVSWFSAIEKFHQDNDFPLEENWREVAEHELCMLLPPGFCAYADGNTPSHQALNPRSTIDIIMSGTRVFMEFVASGGKLVEPEVAEARARTCAACYAATPANGCGACVGLSGLVLDIVGAGKTTADRQLETKQCSWCGCSALANVHIPVEVSNHGVTDEMLSVEIPWCWKIRELRELRAQQAN